MKPFFHKNNKDNSNKDSITGFFHNVFLQKAFERLFLDTVLYRQPPLPFLFHLCRLMIK